LLMLGPSFWLPHAARASAEKNETMRNRRMPISLSKR
jgi:hypothetical protein